MNLQRLIRVVATAICVYQLVQSLLKYLSRPTAVSEIDIPLPDLNQPPVVVICPRVKENSTALKDLGYNGLFSLYVGKPGDLHANQFSWTGFDGSVTFNEAKKIFSEEFEISLTHHVKSSISTNETNTVNLSNIFIPLHGNCKKAQELDFKSNRGFLEVSSTVSVEVFFVDPSLLTYFSISQESFTGTDIKLDIVEEEDKETKLDEQSVENNSNLADEMENVTEDNVTTEKSNFIFIKSLLKENYSNGMLEINMTETVTTSMNLDKIIQKRSIVSKAESSNLQYFKIKIKRRLLLPDEGCDTYKESSYAQCIQNELSDELKPLFQCIPQWMTGNQNDHCNGIVNNTSPDGTDTPIRDIVYPLMMNNEVDWKCKRPCTTMTATARKMFRKNLGRKETSSVRLILDYDIKDTATVITFTELDLVIDIGTGIKVK